MSSKSKRNSSSTTLPNVGTVQSELARRYLRSVVSLLVRIVAVGLLSALFIAQVPGLRQIQILLDMVSGVVILWPFFNSVGKIYGQRIALARIYLAQERWEETAQILAPVEGWRARFFDATGEGRYLRATSLLALDKYTEAEPLLITVEQTGNLWAAKAHDKLLEIQKQKASI